MEWLAIALVAVFGFVVVPRMALAAVRRHAPVRAPGLPWISAALFVVAWLLPNPALAQTRTFTQHAVGGGAACAVLAYWAARNLGVRTAVLRIALTYAVTASFGTAVELAELAYDQTADAGLSTDAPWDLFANVAGAALTATLLEALDAVLAGRRRNEVEEPR